MYSLALIIFSIAFAILWYKTRNNNKLRFDILALISGGSGLMFLVDNIYCYIEEGVLFKMDSEVITLTTILLISVILLWAGILIYNKISRRGLLCNNLFNP